MNAQVTRALVFAWTPWSLALSAVFLLVMAGLCLLSWKRSGYKTSQAVLEAIRFVTLVGVVILFNQPEWVEEYKPLEKPSVVVLHDASESMKTRDVLKADQPTAQPTTRQDALAPVVDRTSWSRLGEKMDVQIQAFSPPKPGKGTDLNTPLIQALESAKNLRGIVLASDGDWTEGQPPSQAAARLRSSGIPVFTVPVGSPTRLPDVELLSLDAPTFAIAGKTVRIPFTIDSYLPREYTTTVTLKTSDGDEVSREVRVAPMTRTTDAVVWKPKTTGDVTLTMNVPKQSDETLVDNNTLSAPIAIREEKLRVLVIESFPRWEYRYLRNALSRDPGVEVSCLLFHPGLGKVGGGNKDYIKEFPAGLDVLSKYDVVFLGDVGLDDGQLTSEQCKQLKGLVEQQASGLVFLPGIQGRQQTLMDTELSELLPVVMDAGQPGGWGSRTPNHFELTEVGRKSLLTKLADTEEENSEVWEGLPGFQWYAAALRAKPGSEVLAVHKDITNEYGRIPLLATRTFGAGKVLFMGTDGAWRWRKGVEDLYHYRFWGQVVRWMAYQRNMAKGESMRLYYTPDQPKMNQTLVLHANVMDKSGEPLAKGDVSARITTPSGRVETVRFVPAGEEWGLYDGRFSAEEPGKHQVALFCRQTNATLEASFFVQGAAAERVGRPARPEVLDEIARITRGKVVGVDKLEEVVRTLANLPEPPPSVRRSQLWSSPVLAGTLVAILAALWIGRKAVGLI